MKHLLQLNLIVASTIATLLIASTTAMAQKECVVTAVPDKVVSVILVNPKQAPVTLVGPGSVFVWDNGAVSLKYGIRNDTQREIASMTIQTTNWDGMTGAKIDFSLIRDLPILPGSLTYTYDEAALKACPSTDLTPNAIAKLGTSNRYWLAMVYEVRFADGTRYEAKKRYEQLERFLRETWNKPEAERLKQVEEFLSEPVIE